MTVAPNPTSAVRVILASRVRRSGGLFYGSVVLLTVVALGAIFAPLVAPYDPDAVNFLAFYSGPTTANWLGTDGLGRDILSRMIFGARTALLGPLLVVISSTVLGILLGLL
ncbi:MAG: ABC transporter permease, partial [Pseudolysinimonas sp.]